MSLKKSHKSYPQAFKDEAVLMVLEQDYSVADAAKSFGVSTCLLYNWKEKHEALQQGLTLEELNRLRRENKELRMKKEILKIPKGHTEASAFFVREMK
jgi:transposase